MVLAELVCAGAAIGTAVWVARFGLFAPREPLSGFQTGLRIAVAALALALVPSRRDRLLRVTLVLAAIAAGSSALFGFGVRAPANAAIRLLFHLAAYVMGAIVGARVLRRQLADRDR